MYKIEFTIRDLPDLQAAASKGHWRAKHAETKRWHERVRAIVLGDYWLPDKPLSQARVVFERHSSREPDYTNLVASMKPIEDGLVRCGVLEDDKPSNYVGGAPTYRWVPAKRGEGKVRVIVDEVD